MYPFIVVDNLLPFQSPSLSIQQYKGTRVALEIVEWGIVTLMAAVFPVLSQAVRLKKQEQAQEKAMTVSCISGADQTL